jgi:hypothetical protein
MVNDIASADDKTITLRAPEPTGNRLIDGRQIFRAFVVNANGENNSISFAYR